MSDYFNFYSSVGGIQMNDFTKKELMALEFALSNQIEQDECDPEKSPLLLKLQNMIEAFEANDLKKRLSQLPTLCGFVQEDESLGKTLNYDLPKKRVVPERNEPCKHESTGKLYQGTHEIPSMFQCTKCGELYR